MLWKWWVIMVHSNLSVCTLEPNLVRVIKSQRPRWRVHISKIIGRKWSKLLALDAVSSARLVTITNARAAIIASGHYKWNKCFYLLGPDFKTSFIHSFILFVNY